jgi:hypothetical protein
LHSQQHDRARRILQLDPALVSPERLRQAVKELQIGGTSQNRLGRFEEPADAEKRFVSHHSKDTLQ